MTLLKSLEKNLTTESQVVRPEYYNIPGHQIPRFYEENDGISITNPNMGLTVSEMIERYVLGEAIQGRNDGVYDEEEDNMTPRNFDLSDLSVAEQAIAEGTEAINHYNAALAAQKIAKAEAKAIKKAQAAKRQNETKQDGSAFGGDEGQRYDKDNERSEEDKE